MADTSSMDWAELESCSPTPLRLEQFLSPQYLSQLQTLPLRPVVVVPQNVLAVMKRHTGSDLQRETMGVLLGAVLDEMIEGRRVSVICQAEPSEHSVSSATTVSLRPESWPQVWQRLDNTQPLIGWYHSHPGFGIFLSATDRRSQSAYFPHPGQVALVLDPVSEEIGAFVDADGRAASLLIVES